MGIELEHARVHAAYLYGGVFDMGTYEGVPVAAVACLYPCHVHLHQGRAAPLACLQHYDAYRLASQALGLEHGGDTALRGVEHKRAFAAVHLVLYVYGDGAPVLKVVAEAQPLPGFQVGFRQWVSWVIEHCPWQMANVAAKAGDCNGGPVAAASQACNGVVWAVQGLTAP